MVLKVLKQVEDQDFLLLVLALHQRLPELRRQDQLLLLAVKNFSVDEGATDGSVHEIVHKQETDHEDASDDEGEDQRP